MGSMVGAGLAMWLAPRAAAEIKERAVGSAKHLGDAVSERYRDARLRVDGRRRRAHPQGAGGSRRRDGHRGARRAGSRARRAGRPAVRDATPRLRRPCRLTSQTGEDRCSPF
ncbi:MAG: hypothetical protein MZW92_53455 [Comamonadaceae bacterium]|nr:hypothetical protein [Comamonadaceae bacterium]